MNRWQLNLVKDIILASLIIFLPFLIYLHLLFNPANSDLVIFGYEIPNRFPSQQEFIWNIMLKLVPINLLSLWYITNRYKWRTYVLIPLLLYIDSLIRFTIVPINFSDITAFVFSICLIFIVIILLIIIRKYYQKTFVVEVKSVKISNLLYAKSKRKYVRFKEFIDRIKNMSVEENGLKYFQNLFVLSRNMEQNIEGPDKSTKCSTTSNSIHSLIIFLFIIMPLIFNVHRMVPENIKMLDLELMSINTYGFPAIDILLWLFFIKTTFLIALSIWFITCQYWWKYAILSPIILVSYQIWEMFQEIQFIDAWGNLRAFPFVLFIILILFILSNYVKYELKVSELHSSISLELEELIGSMARRDQIEDIKMRLHALKSVSGKGRGVSQSHLDSLIELREELIRELEVY